MLRNAIVNTFDVKLKQLPLFSMLNSILLGVVQAHRDSLWPEKLSTKFPNQPKQHT